MRVQALRSSDRHADRDFRSGETCLQYHQLVSVPSKRWCSLSQQCQRTNFLTKIGKSVVWAVTHCSYGSTADTAGTDGVYDAATSAIGRQSQDSKQAPRGKCAAQILLLACGVEDFHQTTTQNFLVLGVKHPRIKAVTGLLGLQPRVFVTQADALMTRRNSIHMHCSSCEALNKEVAEVAGLIDSDPRQELPWECQVVTNYVTIKGSIPQ